MGYEQTMGGRSLSDMPEQEDKFAPLPAGVYIVKVIEAQDKKTKAGDGAYLNFRLDVEGPTHAGRVVWAMHIYQHPNIDAESMGLAKIRGLARAMGREKLPRDLISWAGGRVQVRLKVKPARDGYEASNEVLEYTPLDRGAPMPPADTAPKGEIDRPMFEGNEPSPNGGYDDFL